MNIRLYHFELDIMLQDDGRGIYKIDKIKGKFSSKRQQRFAVKSFSMPGRLIVGSQGLEFKPDFAYGEFDNNLILSKKNEKHNCRNTHKPDQKPSGHLHAGGDNSKHMSPPA